jgi:heavy metal translocating P-type ATPase
MKRKTGMATKLAAIPSAARSPYEEPVKTRLGGSWSVIDRKGMAKMRRLFRYPPETYIAFVALVGILTYLVMRYALSLPQAISNVPLFVVLLVGGLPLLITLVRKLLAREFGSDLLAGISIATSVILGEYIVGCIVVLMLSGGEALEQFATGRASSILQALSRRMPSIAHRKGPRGIVDIQLTDIEIGQALLVLPHELCPVDGIVTEGHGWMDESYLTGEPYRTSKAPGSEVLSGAINGDSAVTIEAKRLPVDSRYARIMRVMQEAEARRPRLRRLGDRLGAWYTPLALAVAGLGWLVTGNAERFLAVVVIATPCPLLLAIPVAIIGAISLAARGAVIVRNPAMLEQIDTCRTVIFDKTGTLTYGKPSLTEIRCAPGFQRDEILRLAASLEQYSKHPLASAVLNAAREEHLELEPVSHINESPGKGLLGTVGEKTAELIGRQTLIREGRQLPAAPQSTGGLESLIFIDGVFAASLHFRDEPREDSHLFVRHLTPRHRVSRVMILSGDRESEVRYLAGRVGIAEVHYGKSPEEKVEIVAEQTRLAPTLFIGDGINDAPAMRAATVGLALGQNSDITSEAADAVVLEPSLGKVDELIHIGRRMRVIALQSAVGGMALSFAGMLIAVAGYLPPIAGAIAQEVIDVAAVLNALRVAFPLGDLTDFGGD